MTKREIFNLILNDLHTDVPDLTASAVVSIDGLPIVTVLERNVDSNRLGSLSAAMMSLSKQAARLLSCGNFNQMTLQADEGDIFMIQITNDLALVSTARSGSSLGMIFVQLRKTINEIRKNLGA